MWRDVRHAWRSIARMPALASVVVLSLAAGIGVNTVVFSWIQARLLKPLPGVAESASFLWIEARTEGGLYRESPGLSTTTSRSACRPFATCWRSRMVPFYVGEPGRTERVFGLLVSGNYFAALKLEPALGRFPAAAPKQRAAEPVAVISHDMWRTRFAGTPAILEQTLRVNSVDLAIVGVTPAGFQGTVVGLEFGLWVPAELAPVLLNGTRELELRTIRGYAVMGRLRPGATLAHAQAGVDGAMQDLARLYPATNAAMRGEVLPFSQSPRGPQRFLNQALLGLQSIMLLLLLAVCTNVANLVLARASGRHREAGVRLALGAAPRHVARLLLMETVMLGLMGSLLGALFAVWGTEALRATPPMRGLPIRYQTSIDGIGLAFAMLLGAAQADQLVGGVSRHADYGFFLARVPAAPQAVCAVLAPGAPLLAQGRQGREGGAREVGYRDV